VRAGKVRFFGLSEVGVATLRRAHQESDGRPTRLSQAQFRLR
jgi:aryl-alcohol dehydrogenase-like predicted oxidoreductase